MVLSLKKDKFMYEFLKEEMTLEDCVVFLEAVSKEMKEKGQREMWKQYSSVLYKLNSYFTKKWNKPRKTKEEHLQKKEEQKRFAEIKEYFEKANPSEETKKFYREKMEKYPNYPIDSEATEYTRDSVSPAGTNPYALSIIYNRNYDFSFLKDAKRWVNGFTFDKSDIKKVEPLIWKFVILHEEGHLYDFAKKYIETGRMSTLGTAQALYGSDDEYKQGVDMESEANSQALKTMYRKDRREFLKQTSTTKKDIEDISKDPRRRTRQMYLGKLLEKGIK